VEGHGGGGSDRVLPRLHPPGSRVPLGSVFIIAGSLFSRRTSVSVTVNVQLLATEIRSVSKI
jgi:hypothetical protein